MEQYRSPAQLAESNPGAIDGFEIEIRRLRAGLDAGSLGRVDEVCDEVLQPEVLIVVFRHPPLLPDPELVQTPTRFHFGEADVGSGSWHPPGEDAEGVV